MSFLWNFFRLALNIVNWVECHLNRDQDEHVLCGLPLETVTSTVYSIVFSSIHAQIGLWMVIGTCWSLTYHRGLEGRGLSRPIRTQPVTFKTSATATALVLTSVGVFPPLRHRQR